MKVVVPASPPTSYHWDAVEPQEVSAALQRLLLLPAV